MGSGESVISPRVRPDAGYRAGAGVVLWREIAHLDTLAKSSKPQVKTPLARPQERTA